MLILVNSSRFVINLQVISCSELTSKETAALVVGFQVIVIHLLGAFTQSLYM